MINYRKMDYKDWNEDSFVNLQRQLEDEQQEFGSMKVRVNTTHYINSHGRSPKGTGCWMFFRDGYRGRLQRLSPRINALLRREGNLVAEGFGTYTEVKVKAIARAKELGITEIHVGS